MEITYESVVIDILEAVSAELDVDPMELPPLAEHIDPEALERVIESAVVDLEISLVVYGCDVSIDANGHVSAVRTPNVH